MSANADRETGEFEARLREGLERLAGVAPPGPSPATLFAFLRRRRRRRWIASAGATLVVVGAAWLALGAPGHRTGRTGAPQVATEAPAGAAAESDLSLPAPLDLRAGEAQLREALQEVFGPLGARNLTVEKEPGEPVSFAVAGPGAPESERLRRGLDRLLFNYDSARIEVLAGNLSYSLMR